MKKMLLFGAIALMAVNVQAESMSSKGTSDTASSKSTEAKRELKKSTFGVSSSNNRSDSDVSSSSQKTRTANKAKAVKQARGIAKPGKKRVVSKRVVERQTKRDGLFKRASNASSSKKSKNRSKKRPRKKHGKKFKQARVHSDASNKSRGVVGSSLHSSDTSSGKSEQKPGNKKSKNEVFKVSNNTTKTISSKKSNKKSTKKQKYSLSDQDLIADQAAVYVAMGEMNADFEKFYNDFVTATATDYSSEYVAVNIIEAVNHYNSL